MATFKITLKDKEKEPLSIVGNRLVFSKGQLFIYDEGYTVLKAFARGVWADVETEKV